MHAASSRPTLLTLVGALKPSTSAATSQHRFLGTWSGLYRPASASESSLTPFRRTASTSTATTTTTSPSTSSSSSSSSPAPPSDSNEPPPTTHYRITLRRSAIGLPKRASLALRSLGLRKRLQSVYLPARSDVAGALVSVKELVHVENVRRLTAREAEPVVEALVRAQAAAKAEKEASTTTTTTTGTMTDEERREAERKARRAVERAVQGAAGFVEREDAEGASAASPSSSASTSWVDVDRREKQRGFWVNERGELVSWDMHAGFAATDNDPEAGAESVHDVDDDHDATAGVTTAWRAGGHRSRRAAPRGYVVVGNAVDEVRHAEVVKGRNAKLRGGRRAGFL